MKKKCKSKKRYAEGGDMLGLISQLGSITGDPLGMGISFGANALDSILELAKDPSDYIPQKVNSGGAYAKGGKVDPPKKKPFFPPDYSKEKSFNKAFEKARESEYANFKYKGKKYNTRKDTDDIELTKRYQTNTSFRTLESHYPSDVNAVINKFPELKKLMNRGTAVKLDIDPKDERGYYGFNSGKINVGNTRRLDDVIIQELAHHEQFSNKNVLSSFVEKTKHAYELLRHGDPEMYNVHGTVENKAHFDIAPGLALTSYYNLDKNKIKTIQKNLGFTGKGIDGIIGPKTYSKFVKLLKEDYFTPDNIYNGQHLSNSPEISNVINSLSMSPKTLPQPTVKEFVSKQLGAGMQGPSKFADGGYLDSAIGDHAFEVGGNAGVDTNARTVKGQDVLLTKGEIVREEPEGAYVFSNSNRKMPHPLTGRSFSDTVKPIEKGIAKAKKSLRRDYTDSISRNTLGHLEQLIEQNKAREEEVRIQKEPTEVQEFARGGDINGLIAALDEARNIRGMSNIHPIAHQMTIDNRVKDYVNWNINKAPLDNKFSNTVYEPLVGPSRTSIYKSDINAPKQPAKYDPTMGLTFKKETPQSNTKIPYEYGYKDGPNTENTSEDLSSNMQYLTPEDKIFMGLKTGETIARMIEAGKPATQYRSEPYEIDRIKYNPQDVLDKNQSTYRALLETNTGNANLDRVIKSSFAGNKMSQDREALRQYANMQSQSDMQVNQYNSQVRQNVDNINEQIAARKYAAKDAAFSSVGNLASIFQQAGGARAHNKITLATLESLSRRYGINMDELKSYIGWGKGGTEDGLVKYKG